MRTISACANRRKTLVASCTLAALLVAGCALGPRQLEKGHIAYNTAVKSAADDELLLNVVRLRYLDTLDFLATTSISSQLSLSVTAGVSGGSSTEGLGSGVLGRGQLAYSTRPTFTFTPQRGQEFARSLIEPVGVDILTYLIAGDWDAKMLLRLLVRSLNGIDNELGLPSPEFKEATDLLAELQMHNQLFVGFVRETEAISDPIDATRVTGTDLVEAAKSGFEFRQQSSGGAFVLTASRLQPVLALDEGPADAEAVLRLLRLNPGRAYYRLEPGVEVGDPTKRRDALSVRTGSLLRAIIYLSQGVDVPAEHVEQGLTTPVWPPGSPGSAIDDIFDVRVAKRKPEAQLAVQHRGYWFYIDDSDLPSRYTFFHTAELFRLGLAPAAAQDAPVLTLSVGGP